MKWAPSPPVDQLFAGDGDEGSAFLSCVVARFRIKANGTSGAVAPQDELNIPVNQFAFRIDVHEGFFAGIVGGHPMDGLVGGDFDNH